MYNAGGYELSLMRQRVFWLTFVGYVVLALALGIIAILEGRRTTQWTDELFLSIVGCDVFFLIEFGGLLAAIGAYDVYKLRGLMQAKAVSFGLVLGIIFAILLRVAYSFFEGMTT